MISALDTLQRLQQGNRRFVEGIGDRSLPADHGDLFVIRVAGNIVAPSQVGCVEFAAEPAIDCESHAARCGSPAGKPNSM